MFSSSSSSSSSQKGLSENQMNAIRQHPPFHEDGMWFYYDPQIKDYMGARITPDKFFGVSQSEFDSALKSISSENKPKVEANPLESVIQNQVDLAFSGKGLKDNDVLLLKMKAKELSAKNNGKFSQRDSYELQDMAKRMKANHDSYNKTTAILLKNQREEARQQEQEKEERNKQEKLEGIYNQYGKMFEETPEDKKRREENLDRMKNPWKYENNLYKETPRIKMSDEESAHYENLANTYNKANDPVSEHLKWRMIQNSKPEDIAKLRQAEADIIRKNVPQHLNIPEEIKVTPRNIAKEKKEQKPVVARSAPAGSDFQQLPPIAFPGSNVQNKQTKELGDILRNIVGMESQMQNTQYIKVKPKKDLYEETSKFFEPEAFNFEYYPEVT